MNQKTTGFGTSSYVKITLLGFAITALWSSLHSIILPLSLLDFVAESQKNTYLGLLTFAGLILAMAAQPIAGAISDRSGFRWGRRRPYVLLGILAGILFLAGIGLAGSFAILLITYCLLQISSGRGSFAVPHRPLYGQFHRRRGQGVAVVITDAARDSPASLYGRHRPAGERARGQSRPPAIYPGHPY
jgi:MFS family permease